MTIKINEHDFTVDCLNGMTIEQLKEKYNCSSRTISQKKKDLGLSNNFTRPKSLCPICNNLICNSNYERHLKACEFLNEKSKNSIQLIIEKISDNSFKCPYCNKLYSKKGIHSHIWRTHTDEGIQFNQKLLFKNKNKPSWNKGLTKDIDKRLLDRADKLKELYKNGKIIPSFKGKKHTEETKRKISEKRRKFLEENPDKVPYIINHSSKTSYPESVMIKALNTADITGWTHNYRNGIYEYDFAFPQIKLDVEIDGGTHELEKVKEIDKKRDEWSVSEGWTVLRFSAKEVKHSLNEIIDIIKKHIEVVSQNPEVKTKLTNFNPNENLRYICKECGGKISRGSTGMCITCSNKHRPHSKKVDRPSYEQLSEDKKTMTMVAIGKKYGVSDNAVRKWIKKYEKELLNKVD